MIHHYLTKYKENDQLIVVSWLQINVFNRSFCFSIRQKAMALTSER